MTEPKTQEEWDQLKQEKQLKIMKGQALNIAKDIVLETYTDGTTDEKIKDIIDLAEKIFKELKDKNYHKL